MSDYDVLVLGAGAAGLVAAERAASRGRRTALLEKNRQPGVKILMSGGTRCNLTHATDARGIVAAYGPPGRFLHSALAALGPADIVALVEAEGVPTKVEATGKIFPVSDQAQDIVTAFLERLERSGATLVLDEPATAIERDGVRFRVVTTRRAWSTEKLIVTTGGRSYPGSGTSGDAYVWLAALGHTIVPPRPALTPLTSDAAWVRELKGITIPDVALRLSDPQAGSAKPIDTRRGSLLFTHFGLSGPVALDLSRFVSGHPRPATLRLEADFMPDVKREELATSIQFQANNHGKRQALTLVPEALPRRLAEALLRQAGVDPQQRLAELSKAGRGAVATALKQCVIPISGTRGFGQAEVTAGGVSLDEVDSRTMQSKLVPNLYLAGEVLDLDGPIGGFNFQAAFSTGWLAGVNA